MIEYVNDAIKPKGYFKAELLDLSNSILDCYEENNLIMDRARYNIANGISGLEGGVPITRIAFGTEGTIIGNLTVPKTAAEGFVSSRTSLFSEQSGGYNYYMDFVPTTNGGYATVTETDDGAGSTIKITLTGTSIQYVIEMSQNAGNNGSSVNYTEAAFYCGANIFSAKCFPVRVKNDATKIRITWTLVF